MYELYVYPTGSARRLVGISFLSSSPFVNFGSPLTFPKHANAPTSQFDGEKESKAPPDFSNKQFAAEEDDEEGDEDDSGAKRRASGAGDKKAGSGVGGGASGMGGVGVKPRDPTKMMPKSTGGMGLGIDVSSVCLKGSVSILCDSPTPHLSPHRSITPVIPPAHSPFPKPPSSPAPPSPSPPPSTPPSHPHPFPSQASGTTLRGLAPWVSVGAAAGARVIRGRGRTRAGCQWVGGIPMEWMMRGRIVCLGRVRARVGCLRHHRRRVGAVEVGTPIHLHMHRSSRSRWAGTARGTSQSRTTTNPARHRTGCTHLPPIRTPLRRSSARLRGQVGVRHHQGRPPARRRTHITPRIRTTAARTIRTNRCSGPCTLSNNTRDRARHIRTRFRRIRVEAVGTRLDHNRRQAEVVAEAEEAEEVIARVEEETTGWIFCLAAQPRRRPHLRYRLCRRQSIRGRVRLAEVSV
jgi:hypothetical protein